MSRWRAQIEQIAFLDHGVKHAGGEAGPGCSRHALDADAIVPLVRPVAQAVAADQLAGAVRAGQAEGQILAGLEGRERLAVVRLQVEGADGGALHGLAADDKFAKAIPRQRFLGEPPPPFTRRGQLLLHLHHFNFAPAALGANPLEGADHAQDQPAGHQSDESEAKVGPEHGGNSWVRWLTGGPGAAGGGGVIDEWPATDKPNMVENRLAQEFRSLILAARLRIHSAPMCLYD